MQADARRLLPRPIRSAPRLPADLAKLRDRFVGDYPELAARTDLLAHVPGALRHLLGLRLELDRADTLPRRYRELAEATMRQLEGEAGATDAVDRLVIGFSAAMRDAETAQAAGCLPGLRRYFTDAQIVELTLVLTLDRAFAQFDLLLEVGVEPVAQPA